MDPKTATELIARIKAERRQSQRETALLGAAYPLTDEKGSFGPSILPLSPWRHLLLLGYENPFVTNRGYRTPDAILQYLWLCSPGFKPYSKLRFYLFARWWRNSISELSTNKHGKIVRVARMRAINAIDAHVAQMLLDRPPTPKSAGGHVSVGDAPHGLAALELVCRKVLNFTGHDFWHTPYAHTNQLLWYHFKTNQPKDAPAFDRARDKARGDYLRRKMRARRAEATV